MREKKKSSFLFTYFSSVAASSVAELIMFPIDLVKTRIQIQGEYYSRIKVPFPLKKKGMFGTARRIVRYEGILQLWSGLSPALARNCLNTRIAMYELLRNHAIIKSPDGKYPVWQGTLAGFSSGALGKLMAVPFDSVKVRMQMTGVRKAHGESVRRTNFVRLFMQRFQEGGIRALWKGAVPSVTRAGLMNLCDVLTYDSSKRFFIVHYGFRDAIPLHFLSGMFAGFASVIVACPLDVVKARMMNQPTDIEGRGIFYRGTIDCFRKTVRNEGSRALYKGFIPFWLRSGPHIVIIWVVVEYIRALFEVESF